MLTSGFDRAAAARDSRREVEDPNIGAAGQGGIVREVRIRAGDHKRYWADLWEYREVLVMLAQRDLSVRYKQTVLGVAWAVLQPLISAVLLAFVFGRIAGLAAGSDIPYTALVLAGILPWQLFSNIVSGAGQSLVSNANLVSKVYFPRLLAPFAAGSVAVVDFGLALIVFIPLLILLGVPPGPGVLMLPVFMVLTVLVALGPGLMVAALSAKYRDFRFVVPFVLQLGMFISPVAYTAVLVGDRLGANGAVVFALNPLVGVIGGFRWALGVGSVPEVGSLIFSVGFAVVFLVIGVVMFARVERELADVI